MPTFEEYSLKVETRAEVEACFAPAGKGYQWAWQVVCYTHNNGPHYSINFQVKKDAATCAAVMLRNPALSKVILHPVYVKRNTVTRY